VGYDDEIGDGSWIIANSIGPKWGDHGYGVIPYSCVSNIGEAYILNNFAGSIPGKKISEN
jgi:C1A family cysteine protease